MNLLTDAWIPVRPLPAGAACKLTLRQLLCEDGSWELCLPRDDMELAALQLLICMTQVFFPPQNTAALKQRIVALLPVDEFESGCAPYREWFRVDHPDFPFMQRKGAKVETPMDKLLAGLTGAQNCCFVNEPNLAAQLCGGCTAIALFNLASCSPSFGGGFKLGLRQGAAITTLLSGDDLRQTIWLNIISEDRQESFLSWHSATKDQRPTWVDPIPSTKIPVSEIGLLRGLFWQPAHVELKEHEGHGICSCCGFESDITYKRFYKDKFSSFDVDGTWSHPHSPAIMTINRDGTIDEDILSFGKSRAPAWTNLARFVVHQQADGKKPGQRPAAVLLQAMTLFNQSKIRLIVGGYQNQKGQATILGRRHEVFTFNPGWGNNAAIVNELVKDAIEYRSALSVAMWVLAKEIISNKSKRTKWLEEIEQQFYRRSEDAVLDTLACINFERPAPALMAMGGKLHEIVVELFNESIAPYRNDPEFIRTTAIARKTLDKHLYVLKPQRDERRDDGTNL